MSRTFKILLVVLLAVIVVQSIAVAVLYRRNAQLIEKPPQHIVIGIPNFDRSAVSPEARAEMFSAVIVDEMNFDHLTLLECLKKLDSRAGLLGVGHIQIKVPAGSGGDVERRVSLKFKDTTSGEILKALEKAFGVRIEITPICIYATYGKPVEKKP